jgi:hypothetical protein
MYELKPILTEQNIDLPTSMYKMKPVNLATSSPSSEEQSVSKISSAKNNLGKN